MAQEDQAGSPPGRQPGPLPGREEPAQGPAPEQEPARESVADIAAGVCRLARAARQGSLATLDRGAPFVSLITPAFSWAGDLVILVSGLSRHGRHLRADPRCSVLLEADASGANPQTAPRVTLTGRAVADSSDAALRDRWVRIHPYGALYAGFADFTLWRVEVERLHWVGGFGRVRELSGDVLRPELAEAAAEPALLAEVNRRHAAGLPGGSMAGGDSVVALDPDGLDLGPAPTGDPNGDARTRRIHFTARASSREALLEAVAAVLPPTLPDTIAWPTSPP